MKKIFKYELKLEDSQTVALPLGARVLTVKEQKGVPCIWCMVNPDETRILECEFRIVCTGQEISETESDRLNYIGTFFLASGSFVGHLFLIGKEIAAPGKLSNKEL